MLCLLVSLSAAAAEAVAAPNPGKTTATTPHAWPPLASATGRVESSPAFSLHSVPPSTDSAVRTWRQIERTPSPPVTIPSLAHVDLTPRLRLALVTQPQVTVGVFGHTTSNVALFSLQW